ncbi:MAG: DUF2178 domain-containing protein [Lachnospiraceae bacterium]|nr:DUF2178 domain-containing protein [Lachnospiraceae bacterium]
MYYDKRKLAISIFETIIGLVLIVFGITGKIDSGVWSAVGTALVAVGIGSILRFVKYRTDENYRNRIDTEIADERMSHLRLKSWGIAAYAFIIAAGIAAIVLLINDMRGQASVLGYCICFVLIVYLISYLILQKKE